MPQGTQDGERRGPDSLAVVLLSLLALAALGAGYLIVSAGYISAVALLGVIGVGGAFVLVHNMGERLAPPKDNLVHGAARPASEQEAQRAARGEPREARLDDREF